MNSKNYLITFSLVALSVAFTYLATSHTAVGSAQVSTAQRVAAAADNEYQVGAVLFMQQAGEYRALAYQAFNLAQWRLDEDFDKKNLKKLPKAERKMPRSVVVDVDETVLDNSAQQVYSIRNQLPFTPSIWTEWVNKRIAKPIPGALDFLNYASRRGVRVFYVTNRNTAEKQGTIDNLKAAGFPDASDETVMVRADTSSKETRRQSILQKYRIVLLIGDNLNDLSNVYERKSVADRFMEVDKTRELFGRKFIVLPNAMYGDWESAIYEYKNLPEAEKKAKRNQALQGF
jgi:5'-nucleotidase (lipoprotein e(P4) family)